MFGTPSLNSLCTTANRLPTEKSIKVEQSFARNSLFPFCVVNVLEHLEGIMEILKQIVSQK